MRQLSFPFLQARGHVVKCCSDVVAPVGPVILRRIDPGKNMARFYSMEVEQDLLGRVVLVRRWGRIGSTGKTRLDEHKGEGEALAALVALMAAKRQRGYGQVRSHGDDVS
jgi:predicted DNA-binding WGR domain protein